MTLINKDCQIAKIAEIVKDRRKLKTKRESQALRAKIAIADEHGRCIAPPICTVPCFPVNLVTYNPSEF